MAESLIFDQRVAVETLSLATLDAWLVAEVNRVRALSGLEPLTSAGLWAVLNTELQTYMDGMREVPQESMAGYVRPRLLLLWVAMISNATGRTPAAVVSSSVQ